MNGVSFWLVGTPSYSNSEAEVRRDIMVSTKESRHQLEGGASHRPITMLLQKNSQGFGFTLRHFIVFPPESGLITMKDEENGNVAGKGAQRHRLEPMDTIFVKSVKEQSPAHQAGLCPGDRLVQVNGHSVLGRSYSQVIALIQNSGNNLELSVMKKDEDVLQLVTVFSQDIYLQGKEPPDSSEAQLLPETPLLCYSPIRSGGSPQTCLDNWQCQADSTLRQSSNSLPSFLDHSQCSTGPTPMKPRHTPPSSLDNWQCRPAATPLPLDNRPSASPNLTPKPCPSWHSVQSSSAPSALDFHFANHNTAIAYATLPPPMRGNGTLRHDVLSDCYSSQEQAAEDISSRHSRDPQDHLVELGLGLVLGPGSQVASGTVEQHRRETLLSHQRAAIAAHDSHWFRGLAVDSAPRSRSCSESLLAAYAEYEHNYGRSVETLAQASALVSIHHQLASQKPLNSACGAPTVPSGGRQPGQVVEQLRGPKRPGGHGPSEQPGGLDQPVQARGQENLGVSRQLQQSRGQEQPSGQRHLGGSKQPGQPGLLEQPEKQAQPRCLGGQEQSGGERQPGQQIAEPQTRWMREDELLDSKRHSSFFSSRTSYQLQSSSEPGCNADREVMTRPQSTPTLSVPDEDRDLLSPMVVLRQKQPPRSTTCPKPGVPAAARRASGSLAQQALDSLSSIPFIGSLKVRRSSYLQAVAPERAKSCDEGLNSFGEENRVFSKLPKRVRSFFTDSSLESLRMAQDITQSKRHSASELGCVGFSDVQRDGWLHYKVLAEKGKKVGGGMRPWKRAFCVLRSHWLFLYRDKREVVLQGITQGSGYSQDHHPPVSVRGCLVDVAYGATKRKHALRLTTQDETEFLLQAEDSDNMLEWIRSIRDISRTDSEDMGLSRESLIKRKQKDRKFSLTSPQPDSSPRMMMMMRPFLQTSSVKRSSKHDEKQDGRSLVKKNKKTGSAKAFGVRLEDCQPAVQHKYVPLVVELCCAVVEASGLEYQGIYRVPGNNAMVSNLQEHLNRGLDIHTAEERCQDLNVISSLLKTFFRKLPEPLFTDDRYLDFIKANRLQETELRLKTMKKLIQGLPDYYRHTLKFLVEHLKKVADHADKNKMEPRNLALVFGPTLVRTSEDNMMDMVTHMADRYQIVETLILHSDWFFNEGNLENQQKSLENRQGMQPVPNIDHLLSNIGRASGGS